jgi:hypothetical protein
VKSCKHAGRKGSSIVNDVHIEVVSFAQALPQDHPKQGGHGGRKREKNQGDYAKYCHVGKYSKKAKRIVDFEKI